jgi:hypothetical protein
MRESLIKNRTEEEERREEKKGNRPPVSNRIHVELVLLVFRSPRLSKENAKDGIRIITNKIQAGTKGSKSSRQVVGSRDQKKKEEYPN